MTKIIVSILIPQIAGLIGSFFTTPSIQTWYAGINKPSFLPPNWLFAPVWITLFLLMGIALYLVWKKGINANGVKIAMLFFYTQLVLNVLWSVLFFGLHRTGFALIELGILWIFILVTLISFWRIEKWAGILFLPYILWVSFAGLLNYFILTLN